MAAIIVKLAPNAYVEWSTIADAPLTMVMTLAELRRFCACDPNFRLRLDRLERTGTSSFHGETAEQIIATNRAGPGETRLTRKELLERYTPARMRARS